VSPTVGSHVDVARRTAVLTTEFAHPIAVVWTLWSDPLKLARWWGPPGMPMNVHRHDLRPGCVTTFTVELPGGPIRGRWEIHDVEPPRALRFTFASDGLEPTEVDVGLVETTASSTAQSVTLRFASDENMRHALDIGFVEGVARSIGTAHIAVRSFA
jgi:uncharacterized protein YndB with AHSA1/START domain